jgi:hypothetical protein
MRYLNGLEMKSNKPWVRLDFYLRLIENGFNKLPDDTSKNTGEFQSINDILYVVNDPFLIRIKLAGLILIEIGCCKLPILALS